MLFVLGGLLVLALPVTVLVLLIDVAGLRRRVRTLEGEVRRLAPGPEAAPEAPAGTPAKVPPPAAAGIESAGPWTPAAPAPVPAAVAPEPATPPPPLRLARLAGWLGDNWFHAISAVSLGLAGIFLLQYGIESGLLTPGMRVLAALAFGAGLIGAGEWIRRRSGDGRRTATANLPSTFSGAGLVVLYAAIIAARQMYGLTGPEVTFAGLVAVGAVAVVFGWFYGPFLAAGGLTGAAVAPFLVGGEAASGTIFYLYYGILGATALAIDAMRRWGWVSALGLLLAYGAGSLVFLMDGAAAGYGVLLAWLAFAAMALPRLEPWPSHPGWTALESLRRAPRPDETGVIPPTRIAAAAMAASSLLLWFASTGGGPTEVLLVLVLLTVLALAPTLWAARARGLSDLVVLPAGAFLLVLFTQASEYGALFAAFTGWIPAEHPEQTPPLTVTIALALAALASAAAAWRSFRGPFPALWAAGAATFPAATAILLELFWIPAQVIGAGFWAGHAIALAALMVAFATRFAAADGDDRRRTAYAALAALTLIALALFILLSAAALTVALAVLVATAAALDRRYRLPEMHWFLAAGVATLGWRLTIDPGLIAYAEDAPLPEVVLAFGAALAGFAAALALLPEGRARTRALLDSALWACGGVFVTVLVWRAVLWLLTSGDTPTVNYWSLGLLGLIWAMLALAQLYRLQNMPELRWLRRALAGLFGLCATTAFTLSLTLLNPVADWGSRVHGTQPLDTLGVAYFLPGAVFAGVAMRAHWLRRRTVFAWLSALFLSMWAFLEIRWFWRGEAIASGGFSQPELYTYTVALLLAGGVLLYQAIARASPGLRRLAVSVIAVAIVKVFFFDVSGLTGLLRVFSFLALGLVLAGLAWLNRWAVLRLEGRD